MDHNLAFKMMDMDNYTMVNSSAVQTLFTIHISHASFVITLFLLSQHYLSCHVGHLIALGQDIKGLCSFISCSLHLTSYSMKLEH